MGNEVTLLVQELERRCAEMHKTLAQYVEELCAAYYAKTNIPPEEAVIVWEHTSSGISIHIRRRQGCSP